MHGFAFYESANVTMSGSFNGHETSFSLEPYPTGTSENPNCFAGPKDLIADAGKNYELNATITWDSAGARVVSRFSAKTYIPKELKILRAYDLERKQYKSGDTVLYLPPPMDLQSNYFIPKYSNDVGGILVSLIYNQDVYWGENSIDNILGQFRKRDTADYAFFGDRRIAYTTKNQQIGNMNKDIDSIPIMGISLPAIGNVNVLFYATTPEYFRFDETFLDGNSRIDPVYNILGGAGIFAGMLVDTFEVNMKIKEGAVSVFLNSEAQESYCLKKKEETTDRDNAQDRIYHRECVEFWDKQIWKDADGAPWHEIPPDVLRSALSMEQIVTWCKHRYFPIEIYPLCGSALVRYSKSGKVSPVLAREVKKWCDSHKNDPECA